MLLKPTAPSEIWVYLASHPLFWLTATLVAYIFAARLGKVLGHPPWANPVLIGTSLLAALLFATSTDYATYFNGAQFVHFLLGPATVALAVPLYRNIGRLRESLVPLLIALLCGSLTAILSTVFIAKLLGAPPEVLASLAPRSVTTPIAMSLAENSGGIPALAACMTLITAMYGAIIITPLLNFLGIEDFAVRGFAAGVGAHGMGAARAFQVSPVAGAFAGIAIGLNGALTAILLPLILPWISHVK
jgi:predicted murein hydrolase (TIGR00659 family)